MKRIDYSRFIECCKVFDQHYFWLDSFTSCSGVLDCMMLSVNPAYDLVPDQIVSIVDRVLLYVKSGLGLLWLFVPFELVKVMIPLVIAVVNFDKLYSFAVWVLKKIPMLGIE
mgnify:CR=1 FL=1